MNNAIIISKMSISFFYAAYLLVSLTNLLPVSGFNLETRLPVIKIGQRDSYFGYAVAAHQIQPNMSEGLILVGAPLGQNLQPNTTRSGALWKCPLTNYPNDCTQVVTDGRYDATMKIQNRKNFIKVDDVELHEPTMLENKTNQWLGVTVRSQGPGGKVMVCAHLYKTLEEISAGSECIKSDSELPCSPDINIWAIGLCYILHKNLDFQEALYPCKGKNNGIEEHGYCQAGSSGLIFEDDLAVIGAPGSLVWRGAVFVSSVSDNFLSRDHRVYEGIRPKLRNKDAYMGMSLTAGYFLGDNITVFVAGAPRGNETGQVVLFTKDLNRDSGVENGLKEYMIINGEQIASNFGYEVIGADVNRDGRLDLIVAAPFYFSKNEGGAVYVYLNDPEKYLRVTPTKLTGKPESRFGFALSRLGDLNKDGYEDIAVGAPYENNGAVYIYLGSQDGLTKNPSQIIKAEMLNTDVPISTFGYSLSGGIDLDENGYPDLVVGAYEKDVVVLLRARPIIGLRTSVKPASNLSNFDPNARNCQINNNYIPCFHFETCCVIDSIVKTGQRELLIQYKLQAETFDTRVTNSRIWFDDFNTKNETILKNITIKDGSAYKKLEFCEKHTAYLKENTADIQSPIQMKMSYTLIHKQPQKTQGRELPRLDNFPILNQQEADKIFNATFLKDCGANDICESELHLSSNLSLELRDHIAGSESKEYDFILGKQTKVFLNVTVNNTHESSYETKLFVQMPKPVSYGKLSAVIRGKTQYDCRAQDSLVVCKLGNPLKSDEVVALQLEFDFEKVDDSEPVLEFKVHVNTTSIDQNRNNNEFTLKIHIVETTNLSIYGLSEPEEIPEFINTQLKGESAITYKDEIGYKVIHEYNIINSGSWRVSDVKIHIEWPYQVANDKEQGKWLLYLEENPSVGGEGSGSCEILPSKYINPLKLSDRRPETMISNYSLSNTFLPGDKNLEPKKLDSMPSVWSSRGRRDTEKIVMAEVITNDDGVKTKRVHMSCLLGSAKCVNFICYLDSLESNRFFKIIIKSRLWDATLIEDYSDVDQIYISSRAKMHFQKSKIDRKIESPVELQVTTRARVILNRPQSSAPVPLIIIIAAILVGLLLFILLTLLLWKFGFFKRRRLDPTLSGNLEKHRIDDN